MKIYIFSKMELEISATNKGERNYLLMGIHIYIYLYTHNKYINRDVRNDKNIKVKAMSKHS